MTENKKQIPKTSLALEEVFKDTGNFVILGLTGRTGSGCSTAADILTSISLNLPDVSQSHYEGNEARKYRIIKSYMDSNWSPFLWLQVRTVITRYILTLNYSELIHFLSQVLNIDKPVISKALSGFKDEYVEAHKIIISYTGLPEGNTDEIEEKKIQSFNLYFNWLPAFSDSFREQLKNISQNAYTKLYQAVGDNVRASGTPRSRVFNPKKVFNFSSTINKIIKAARFDAMRKSRPCLVVLDAIRNPYEAAFFKERYADFYLVSINTSNENRLNHLRTSHKFSEIQIEELDNKEYPKRQKSHEKFVSQNIQKCIETSDIHINNPRTNQYDHNELRCQLAWYVTLILHPGLIMPTAIERCMQIAASAKLNSGCISRQVGAIVTDQNYSVKAIGWNNSPQGQVPCILRSAEDLISGKDGDVYSTYEKNDAVFRDVLVNKYGEHQTSPLLKGRNLSYCFKDLKNEVDKEKNQVHTRSLHAEENAFLQITKYGGQKLDGGILFTTASPCELCSKKAYQLGIKDVVYIDPYPGIATQHTLAVGSLSPELTLFRGAIGVAYHKLYSPVMAYKDELETLLTFPKNANKKDSRIKELEGENSKLREEIIRLKDVTLEREK